METALKPPTDVQLKRREKELNLLSKLPPTIKYTTIEAPIGLALKIEFDKETFKVPLAHNLIFHVLMDYKYPFQPPRVHLLTDFLSTSLNDYRDLLLSILGHEWMPSVTIEEIISAIPDFIEKTYDHRDSEEYVRGLGVFHLGEVYDVNWFNDTPCKIFKAQEESLADTGVEEPRIVVLSDNFLLVFEPEQRQTTAGDYSALNACVGFNRIKKVRKSLKTPNVLTIHWQLKDQEPGEIKLRMEDVEGFMTDLMRRYAKLGGKVACNKKNKDMCIRYELPSEYQMGQLLGSIKELEANQSYGELAKVYQKAAAYYHSKGSETYKIYLQRLKETMEKRDSTKSNAKEPVKESKSPEAGSGKGLEMKIIHV